MGNPKQKWTAEEEEALRAGVAKHGPGKWKHIQRDPEFNPLLFSRTNIDLKDKWRNLSVANGLISPREKSKTAKAKANPGETPAAPLPIAHTSVAVTPLSQDVSQDVVMVIAPRSLPEENNAAKCNVLIYEALSTLKERNGSDSGAIASYIEQRQEVPKKFKKMLSSRLRRLVQQDKLEKIESRYKIKNHAQQNTKLSAMKQKDIQPSPIESRRVYLGDTVEEATITAAYKIAEAENKAFVAAESVKEAEWVSIMAEEMESLLQFAIDCFDLSACGEILLMV